MMVQEQGVAVGWPLNLGHDTTGWPLGLRLRLMHEDLQWPTMPELALSTSCISTDSSSLDTASTRSFFQDKSKSLGALMGLPILDSAGNPLRHQHEQQQRQRERAFRSPSTFTPNTPSSSPAHQTANNAVTRRATASHRRLHGPSSAQQHVSTSSTAQGLSSAASSAGWSLLSALSCARVPAEIGSPVNHEDEETSTIPRARVVTAREIPSRSFVQDPELEQPESVHQSTTPPTVLYIRDTSQEHFHLSSLARKLYDNITFEDEELEVCSNKQRRSSISGLSSDASSEWNPLFASSPHAARDEEDNEEYNDENYQQRLGSMTTICDHFLEQRESFTTAVPLISLMRSSNKNSDALLYCRKGSRLRIGGGPTSTTFCVDVGKWQQKQKSLGHGTSRLVNTPTDQDSQFISEQRAQDSLKSRAVSAFIYRMVCCRRTPTRGSSF